MRKKMENTTRKTVPLHFSEEAMNVWKWNCWLEHLYKSGFLEQEQREATAAQDAKRKQS